MSERSGDPDSIGSLMPSYLNPNLANQIMSIISDKEKFNIITCVFDQPKLSSEIIKECQIAQTTGYRKIRELFQEGFLIEEGYATTSDGRKAYKYNSLFGPTKIDIQKSMISIKTRISKRHAKTSKVFQIFEIPLVTP